jgi:branched-chain amino acid transport system permease protein
VLAGTAAVVLAPRIVSDFRTSQLAYLGIYAIALAGLVLLTGYTGQISLGHGAFMALGGYTTALLVADHGVRDVATIPLAALVGAGAGLVVGVPALRLTGLHLAVATLGLAVATPALLRELHFTGGGRGIQLFGVPEYTGKGFESVEVAGVEVTFNQWLYTLSWATAGVLLALAWVIARSRVGLRFRALRDSEAAAASSGVDVARYKALAFVLSAAYAAVAGSLLALANTFVNPEVFSVNLSLYLVVGLVVGGLRSLAGVVAGAALIEFLPDVAQDISRSPGIPTAAYGLVLVLLVLLAPEGPAALARRLTEPLSRRL